MSIAPFFEYKGIFTGGSIVTKEEIMHAFRIIPMVIVLVMAVTVAPTTVKADIPTGKISKEVNLLIDDIVNAGIHRGITNSLTSKLNNVLHYVEAGAYEDAIDLLGAFINQVQAQAGKKITVKDAVDYLVRVNVILALFKEPEQVPAYIVFTTDPPPFMSKEQTATVTAVVYDVENEPIEEAEIIWSSSDPEYVTVNETTGLVTAIKDGGAYVVASYPEIEDVKKWVWVY